MPDFDATVALGAKGYDPQDAVAPLQSYLLGAQGRNADAEAQSRDISNQLASLSLASRQSYAKTLATPGANQLAGLNASGLGAYDPESAGKALGNIQSTNALGAYQDFGKTHDPYTLAPAGPEAVGQGAVAQNTLAQTLGVNQDTEKKKVDLRGQIALGYKTALSKAQSSAEADLAWHKAVAQSQQSGLITDFQTLHAIDNIKDPGERMAIANLWAGSGSGSVVNSGTSASNITRETTVNTPIVTAPGQSVWTSDQLRNAMTGGQTPTSRGTPPPAPTYGRSVATDGTPAPAPVPAPVGPAPGNGSRPIAGGFLGNGGGAPTIPQQPQMMTQAEQAYGLPVGFIGGTSRLESRGNPSARNPSGAMGLMQNMPSTWAQYARPGQNPYNAADSIDVSARLAADNQRTMARALGRPPTAPELYLAHQQGAGGAIGLLSNPTAPAASIIGAKALISNGGTPNMTAGQFAGMWEQKFNGAGNSGNFTLSGPSPMGQGVSMPENPAMTLPSSGGIGLRAAAAANAPPAPSAQPDLTPPVAGPIQLPSSTQPMPASAPSPTTGRSASDDGLPQTRQLSNGSGLQPLVKGMSPFEYAKQGLDAARAVDEEKTARDQFIAAGDAQRGLMQLQEDLTKLTPGPNANLRDTLLAPGSGADTRIGLAKAINSTLATVGARPLFDPDKITAAESAAKTSGRLGFDLAGGLGGGSKAGFIVNEAIGLNPSVMNTPGGGKLLTSSLMAAQQRLRDLYLYQGEFARENGGNPIGAEIEFDQSHPPMRYVQDAQKLARVPLSAAKFLEAHPDQGTISAFNEKYGPSLARYYLGSRTD